VNDDEYLGGVMGLSHELARLAIKRASAMEVEAVVRCRDLLQSLNGKLLGASPNPSLSAMSSSIGL
jgi:hypothetical protein